MELDNWGHFGIERYIADAMKSKALNIHGQLPRQLRVNAMIIRVRFLARKGGVVVSEITHYFLFARVL